MGRRSGVAGLGCAGLVVLGGVRQAGAAVVMVPSVARVAGANGTQWRSSAVLDNPTASSQQVLLELLPRGLASVGASKTLTLAPAQTLQIDNLYDFLQAADGAGTLRVTGNVIAWARTYNQGATGTFGQDLPAVPLGGGFAAGAGMVFPFSTPADVAQNFRSNLVLLDLDSADITVTLIAAGIEKTTTVPAGAYVQINNLGAFLGTSAGFGVVQVSATGRWFGAISTIDPFTGDPTTMRGLNTADTGMHLFPGVASLAGVNGAAWRSEVDLNNAGGAPIQALLELIPRGQGQVAASAPVALAPGATTRIADLYQFLGAASGAGTLRVSGGALAWVRTYNEQGQATFGQDLPPVAPAGGFGPTEMVAFQFRSPASVATDFRSNLVLENLETRDITVSLRAGGGEKTQVVPASSYLQINDLGAFLGAAVGTGTVWATADGHWTGSVSTIDPFTNDPTTFRGVEGWQPASSADLINAALAAGSIGSEQALTYRVFADFSDPRLPSQFLGDDRNVLEMPSVDDAVARFASLSPATQDVVGPFLAPPFYQGSWWDLAHPTGSGGVRTSARAPASTGPPCSPWRDSGCPIRIQDWSHVDGAHLRIWYQTAFASTDGALANTLLGEGEGTIWPALVGVMGVAPILGKDSVADTSPHLDVILNRGLANSSDGRTTPTEQWLNPNWHCQASLTFIVLNAAGGHLRQALAHEMMHAAQHAVSLQNCSPYTWLADASATWFEDNVYHADNDEHRFAPIYLGSPELSLDDVSKPNRAYSGYLFFFYLTRVRGNVPTTAVGDAWAAAAGADAVHAVASALTKNGADIATAWPDFALYGWNQDAPYDAYQTVDGLRDQATTRKQVNATLPNGDNADELESVGDLKMPYLSIRYYEYDFTDATVSTVTFFNGMNRAVDLGSTIGVGSAYTAPPPGDPSAVAGAHVDALLEIDGTWTHEDWTSRPYRSFCRDATAERLQKLVIILSNADIANPISPPGPHPPLLWASNIGCFAWVGNANLTAHYPGQPINDTMTIAGYRFELLGDAGLDAVTPYMRGFKSVAGTFTWTLSGSTNPGCTLSGKVDNGALADTHDAFVTFPWITDGTDHRVLRAVFPQAFVDGTLQFPAKVTCQGKTTTSDWPLTFYVISSLEAQGWVRVSDDGKSIDVDVTKLPTSGFGQVETGTWHFDAKQQ